MRVARTQQLIKTFQQAGTAIEVLKGVDLDVAVGETVAILGKSGSGKSTLLSLLAGLDHPSQGSVEWDGQAIQSMDEKALARFRARVMGIVFQQFHLMSNLTALENVALPLEIARKDGAQLAAAQALEKVGLSHRHHHFPHQLSGGEKQRVAIARALVVEPKILLADEPSGNLDVQTGEQVMNLLFDLVKQKKTSLILVTHNEELARRCDRRLKLENGKLYPWA